MLIKSIVLELIYTNTPENTRVKISLNIYNLTLQDPASFALPVGPITALVQSLLMRLNLNTLNTVGFFPPFFFMVHDLKTVSSQQRIIRVFRRLDKINSLNVPMWEFTSHSITGKINHHLLIISFTFKLKKDYVRLMSYNYSGLHSFADPTCHAIWTFVLCPEFPIKSFLTLAQTGCRGGQIDPNIDTIDTNADICISSILARVDRYFVSIL